MSPHAVSRTPPAADLLRLAIPLVLIASAVIGTLWIDRTGYDAGPETHPTASASR